MMTQPMFLAVIDALDEEQRLRDEGNGNVVRRTHMLRAVRSTLDRWRNGELTDAAAEQRIRLAAPVTANTRN